MRARRHLRLFRLPRPTLWVSCGAAFCAAGLACPPAAAALLRPFSQITGPTVHLADLFDQLGSTPDRVLGRAPLPGGRIVVNAPQLAAIARDFDVDWRPASGSEQSVIERRGDTLPRAAILSALHDALVDAGAPADIEILAPDLQEILVPAGTLVQPVISQASYDERNERFTALITVAAPEMESRQIRLSGNAFAMVQTAVATHRLSHGSLLQAADITQKRVRASLLHGAAPLAPQAGVGLTLRRDVAAGQPVTPAELVKTSIVQRGDRVRMTLQSEGLSLSAQGIASQAGALGDRIRVENPVSHRLVDAEIIGPGEVSVAPRAAAISLATAQ